MGCTLVMPYSRDADKVLGLLHANRNSIPIQVQRNCNFTFLDCVLQRRMPAMSASSNFICGSLLLGPWLIFQVSLCHADPARSILDVAFAPHLHHEEYVNMTFQKFLRLPLAALDEASTRPSPLEYLQELNDLALADGFLRRASGLHSTVARHQGDLH